MLCYIYSTHIVMVLMNTERNHYIFHLHITEVLPGLLSNGALLYWPLYKAFLWMFHVTSSTENCTWSIIKLQICTIHLAHNAVPNTKYFQGIVLRYSNISLCDIMFCLESNWRWVWCSTGFLMQLIIQSVLQQYCGTKVINIDYLVDSTSLL